MRRADRDRLRRYYAEGAEPGRLEADEGWFELERTVGLVGRFAPPPARLLDMGGGPGHASRRLAAMGYEVTLADLSPELIERARELRDARPEVFDEVVALTDASAEDDAVVRSCWHALYIGRAPALARTHGRTEAS